MVVGDPARTVEHFSPLKKRLQRLGSWVVRQRLVHRRARHDLGLPRLQPRGGAPDGRVSRFTYTLETIIQAGKLLVAVDHVPVRTNPQLRESRLFPSMWSYVRRNTVAICGSTRSTSRCACSSRRAVLVPRRARAVGAASGSSPAATAPATSSR